METSFVAKSSLTKAIHAFEENCQVLDKHGDVTKFTKTRLAAALMESLEIPDKKSKKIADAREQIVDILISLPDEDVSKTKDALIERSREKKLSTSRM